MRTSRLRAAAVLAFAVAVPLALATTRDAITPTSIAGAKLGLGRIAYLRLLGRPARFQAAAGGKVTDPGFQQPANFTRLVFAKRKMDVYFQDGVDRATIITTWNKAHRTAGGVGPCSTLAQVRKAYGSRLKSVVPGRPAGGVYSYLVGRSLMFMFADYPPRLGLGPSPFVTAVVLYDGSHPGWNKPGGAVPTAGYIASYGDQISCHP
jgi:hypothetical protein